MREGFIFYSSFAETINKLKEVDVDMATNLMFAIMDYGIYLKEPEDPMISAIITSIVHAIDHADDRYAKSKRRKGV